MDIILDNLKLYETNEIKVSENSVKLVFTGKRITYAPFPGKWAFADNELTLDTTNNVQNFRFHFIPTPPKKPPTVINITKEVVSNPPPIQKPAFMFLHDFFDSKAVERVKKFAPILKNLGIEWIRCWTNPLITYGTQLLWKELGFKVHLTISFNDNLQTINSPRNSPNEFKSQFSSVIQRIANCDIVQFWNEPQYKHYTPRDVDSDAGFKFVCDNYYIPLSKALGKERIASPSFTPHFGAEKVVPMLSKAGFFDPALCSYIDIHPYWYPGAKVEDITSKLAFVRQYTNLPFISSEFNINLNKYQDQDYVVKFLEPQLATLVPYFGSNPMSYFIATQTSRHPGYPGIWDLDGKMLNPKILDLLMKYQK